MMAMSIGFKAARLAQLVFGLLKIACIRSLGILCVEAKLWTK